MTKTTLYTLFTLVFLTVITALISIYIDLHIAVFFILIIAAIKFIFVAFQFMELKKANSFWKGIILGFLFLFTSVILVIYYN